MIEMKELCRFQSEDTGYTSTEVEALNETKDLVAAVMRLDVSTKEGLDQLTKLCSEYVGDIKGRGMLNAFNALLTVIMESINSAVMMVRDENIKLTHSPYGTITNTYATNEVNAAMTLLLMSSFVTLMSGVCAATELEEKNNEWW